MRIAKEMPLDSMTPEELAAASQRGSAAAFGKLVELFEVRLFNFLLRKVGNRLDAEDLTQEAFLRAWKRIGSYRAKWRFSTWLYTIASRLAISHARRKGARSPAAVSDETPAPMPPEPSMTCGSIWRLVDEALTQEQRTAVWLRYVEDLGIPDIATVMGKSHVGIRVMLFRARSILADRLEPEVIREAEASSPPGPVVRTGGSRPVVGVSR